MLTSLSNILPHFSNDKIPKYFGNVYIAHPALMKGNRNKYLLSTIAANLQKYTRTAFREEDKTVGTEKIHKV